MAVGPWSSQCWMWWASHRSEGGTQPMQPPSRAHMGRRPAGLVHDPNKPHSGTPDRNLFAAWTQPLPIEHASTKRGEPHAVLA